MADVTQNGKIKRRHFGAFMNIKPGTSPQYELMGPGITNMSISYNPQTEDETYIHEDTGSTDVTGYRPTVAATQSAFKGDPVFKFLDGLRQKRAILSDAHTDIILTYDYDGTGDTVPAEKQEVSIQFNTFGGEGGSSLSIEYDLNFLGDAEQGSFSRTSKTFTKG